jgi:hypothetical protein
MQDTRLEIVRILIEHGADPNHENGTCFTAALKTMNLTLLKILCIHCKVNQTSAKSALPTALDPCYFQLPALELLLRSTTATAEVLDSRWVSDSYRGNPNISVIVPCFLRHRMNVDLGDAVVLRFALEEENLYLIGKILTMNPQLSSLKTAFKAQHVSKTGKQNSKR